MANSLNNGRMSRGQFVRLQNLQRHLTRSTTMDSPEAERQRRIAHDAAMVREQHAYNKSLNEQYAAFWRRRSTHDSAMVEGSAAHSNAPGSFSGMTSRGSTEMAFSTPDDPIASCESTHRAPGGYHVEPGTPNPSTQFTAAGGRRVDPREVLSPSAMALMDDLDAIPPGEPNRALNTYHAHFYKAKDGATRDAINAVWTRFNKTYDEGDLHLPRQHIKDVDYLRANNRSGAPGMAPLAPGQGRVSQYGPSDAPLQPGQRYSGPIGPGGGARSSYGPGAGPEPSGGYPTPPSRPSGLAQSSPPQGSGITPVDHPIANAFGSAARAIGSALTPSDVPNRPIASAIGGLLGGSANAASGSSNSQYAASGSPTMTAGGQKITPPSSSGGGNEYVVQKGDTLSSIAAAHGFGANNWHELYSSNKGTIGGNPNLIMPGQKLSIPQGAAFEAPAHSTQPTPAALNLAHSQEPGASGSSGAFASPSQPALAGGPNGPGNFKAGFEGNSPGRATPASSINTEMEHGGVPQGGVFTAPSHQLTPTSAAVGLAQQQAAGNRKMTGDSAPKTKRPRR